MGRRLSACAGATDVLRISVSPPSRNKTAWSNFFTWFSLFVCPESGGDRTIPSQPGNACAQELVRAGAPLAGTLEQENGDQRPPGSRQRSFEAPRAEQECGKQGEDCERR